MKIRLTIAPGDHFDIEVKPFDELTVAEHIRIYEGNEQDTGYSPLDMAKNRLVRITGAPDRFIRFMSAREVDELTRVMNEQTAAQDRTLSTMAKVYETLDQWEKEHDGKPWTVADALAVLEGHSLFRGEITVEGRTYTAPLIEETATFGQWIDLQAAMDLKGMEAESMGYVRALAVFMQGEDGPYPVQRNDETDEDYRSRANAYTRQRMRDFQAARFIDVLGVAAFFFFRSERFAAICAHSMTRFQSLTRHSHDPTPKVIPTDGGLTLN